MSRRKRHVVRDETVHASSEVTIQQRQIGVVKEYSYHSGMGYISPEGGGSDVFINAEAVRLSGITRFERGMKVSYIPIRMGSGSVYGSMLQFIEKERRRRIPMSVPVHHHSKHQ